MEQTFCPHDMQKKHGVSLNPVEDATWWNDNFPIRGPWKLGRTLSGIGKTLKPFYTLEHPFDKPAGRRRIVERNVVANSFEVAQGRFSPDQASHFFILRLASS